jgi:aspartate/tyrosine/aromatic aminotransferase
MKSGTTRLINKDKAMKKLIASTLCSFVSASVLAALPPLTPEAQEAAALAKAKAAYGDRVGAFQLCQSQNRVADRFKVAGTPAPAACTAPPPFVPPVASVAAPATPAAK